MPSASPSPRKLGSGGPSLLLQDLALLTASPLSPSLPSPGSAHCWETRLLTAGPKPCRATLPAPRSASFQARCGRHPPPPSSHGLFSSMAATPPRMFFLRPRGLCAAVTSCGPAAVLLPGAPSRAAPLQPRSSPGSCGLCLGFPLPHPPSSCGRRLAWTWRSPGGRGLAWASVPLVFCAEMKGALMLCLQRLLQVYPSVIKVSPVSMAGRLAARNRSD